MGTSYEDKPHLWTYNGFHVWKYEMDRLEAQKMVSGSDVTDIMIGSRGTIRKIIDSDRIFTQNWFRGTGQFALVECSEGSDTDKRYMIFPWED